SNQAALDQMVWIVAQDLAILAGARLGFVGVDDEVMRAPIIDLGHKAPFEAGREPSAATAAQAGGLDLIGQPFPPLVEQILGAAPGATALGPFKAPIVLPIEICE